MIGICLDHAFLVRVEDERNLPPGGVLDEHEVLHEVRGVFFALFELFEFFPGVLDRLVGFFLTLVWC